MVIVVIQAIKEMNVVKAHTNAVMMMNNVKTLSIIEKEYAKKIVENNNRRRRF